jgi:hypothetical protein
MLIATVRFLARLVGYDLHLDTWARPDLHGLRFDTVKHDARNREVWAMGLHAVIAKA